MVRMKNKPQVTSGVIRFTEELEENDCQETNDLRSGINIERGQNEEQAASHIRCDPVYRRIRRE